MLNSILGTKIDQTQTFTEEGKRIPVTRIKTGPQYVVVVKTQTTDGYNAIQLGLGKRRIKTVTKPLLGHLKKAGLEKNPPRFLKEVGYQEERSEASLTEDGKKDSDIFPKAGEKIKAGNIFKKGDTVEIEGISKGKGFQGVVKRHHFKGGPRTHGQSDRERAPGSIGQTTTPGRVYKGKRMAGRMGNDQTVIKNLKVVNVDTDKDIMTVSGLIPGGRNRLIVVRKLSG